MSDTFDAAQEQPTPHGRGTPIVELVKVDLERRAQAGEAKYGERLKAHNGRDPLIDAYQEVLDQSVYIRQEIEERAHRRARAKEIVDSMKAQISHSVYPGGEHHASCDGCWLQLKLKELVALV